MNSFQRKSVLLLAALALHCGGCNPQPPNPDGGTVVQTGTLVIGVSTPAGVAGSVTVTGPGGYSRNITQTTTLSAIPAGSYTVTAANASQPTPLVPLELAGMVTGSPANVAGGAVVTATVTYTNIPGTGMLWAPVWSSSQWVGLSVTDIAFAAETGFVVPSVTLRLDGGQLPDALAFDRTGNLWGVDRSDNVVMSIPASQLGQNAVVSPLILSAAVAFDAGFGDAGYSIDSPPTLAFDGQGNLWIGNCGNNGSLARFTPDQLATSGAPVPATMVVASQLSCVTGLAFDGDGGLWVSNQSGPRAVMKLSIANLLGGAAFSPEVMIVDDGGFAPLTLGDPENLALDPTGDLWVTYCTNLLPGSAIVHYQADAGWAAKDIVIPASDAGLVTCPVGIAFDSQSNLWISQYPEAITLEYSPDQINRGLSITASMPIPTRAFVLPGQADWCGIAFNPTPQQLRLGH